MHGGKTDQTVCCSRGVVQFFTKGVAQLCCMVEIINDDFSDEAVKKEVEDRLMPRTQDLPLYTTLEFNDKVVAGIEAAGCRTYSSI